MKYYISILISVLLIMFSGCSIKQEEEQNQVENIEKTENNGDNSPLIYINDTPYSKNSTSLYFDQDSLGDISQLRNFPKLQELTLVGFELENLDFLSEHKDL